MGRRSCQSRVGGLSTPILLLDRVKSSGQWWACPSHWKLWPQEPLPQLLPGSASLGCQGARPTPGSWEGLSGHDRASTVGFLCLAGLGLPCPACLLYESPLGPGSETGGGSSQTLSRLSPVSPQAAPGASTQPCCLLAVRGTDCRPC